MAKKPRVLILDVDGVLTDGRMYYSAEGKMYKCFGPDDHDGISLIKNVMEVQVITGDKRGFSITEARVARDMKLPLNLVSTVKRAEWIAERYPLDEVVYMGDGFFDALVMRAVGYAMAPADADPNAIAEADYVCRRDGGRRAVAEACVHLLNTFFEPFDLFSMKGATIEVSGTWVA